VIRGILAVITYGGAAMDNFELEMLKDRVSRLEAKNRILYISLWALFVILSPLIMYTFLRHTTNPGVVKAKTIELAGYSGDARVWLGQVPDGSLGIKVDDANGETRANLSLNQIGVPELYLNDSEGHHRISASLSLEGEPEMFLYGDGFKKAMDIHLYKGLPSLDFYDTDSGWRASLGLSDDGSGLLTFMYPKGLPSAMLSTDSDGEPSLALFGAKDAYTSIEPR
jgi:hypothetical protein